MVVGQNDCNPVKVEISRRDECHTWPAKNEYFKLGGSLHGSIHGSMTGIFDSKDIESFWRGVGVPMPTQSRCNDLLPDFENDLERCNPMHLTEQNLTMLPGGVAMPPLPPDWSHLTTMMMRNLPNKYTQRMLLTEVNQSGFLGTIDFFYLPIDQETNANRGYGFLNFIAPYYAWAFRNMFEGRRMSRFNSAKVVSVQPATLQGFQANYAHYSSARVNRGDPSARPLFLREPSPELSPNNDSQEKNNSNRRQRKGKLQTSEQLNTLPKARLGKKSIEAGNYQQQDNQYQHQQESSEATTTAQDSQESTESFESQESQSFESQESQSSHSDSREDSRDCNVTSVKSRQQSRQGNQRQKQQAQQQKKEESQKHKQKKQNQQRASKPPVHQQKKADRAVDDWIDGPYFIDNGASILPNGSYSSYSSGLSRTLAGLDSLSGYPAQFDPVQYAGLNMGSLVQPQQWSSPDLSSCQNSSLSGLSPAYCGAPGLFDFANMGPTSSINVGQKFKQQGEKPPFCPHCGNRIKPNFQFCPHCGNGLACLQ